MCDVILTFPTRGWPQTAESKQEQDYLCADTKRHWEIHFFRAMKPQELETFFRDIQKNTNHTGAAASRVLESGEGRIIGRHRGTETLQRILNGTDSGTASPGGPALSPYLRCSIPPTKGQYTRLEQQVPSASQSPHQGKSGNALLHKPRLLFVLCHHSHL